LSPERGLEANQNGKPAIIDVIVTYTFTRLYPKRAAWSDPGFPLMSLMLSLSNVAETSSQLQSRITEVASLQ
jgi:hypothetical protein